MFHELEACTHDQPNALQTVSVVVCTAGRSKGLRRCLDALQSVYLSGHEVILVLSGNEAEKLRPELEAEGYGLWLLMLSQPQTGVSAARNLALRQACGEILLLVDDDAVVDTKWLQEMLRGFQQPAVAVVTGRVLPEGPAYSPAHYASASSQFRVEPEDPRWVELALSASTGAGCNMGFRRKSLLIQGGFPEDLGAGSAIGCGDEPYLFIKHLQAGGVLVHNPEAIVTHIFEDQPHEDRLRQLFAGNVALHLKLVTEEPLIRWRVLQALAKRATKAAQLTLQPEAGHGWNRLSYWDRWATGFRGIWLYFRSRRRISGDLKNNAPRVASGISRGWETPEPESGERGKECIKSDDCDPVYRAQKS